MPAKFDTWFNKSFRDTCALQNVATRFYAYEMFTIYQLKTQRDISKLEATRLFDSTIYKAQIGTER